MIKGSFLWALVLVALKPFWTLACTNYLLTKGATVEHVNRITYSADSHTLYGALYHYPAKDHLPGTVSSQEFELLLLLLLLLRSGNRPSQCILFNSCARW